jgi:hypothetical protein
MAKGTKRWPSQCQGCGGRWVGGWAQQGGGAVGLYRLDGDRDNGRGSVRGCTHRRQRLGRDGTDRCNVRGGKALRVAVARHLARRRVVENLDGVGAQSWWEDAHRGRLLEAELLQVEVDAW